MMETAAVWILKAIFFAAAALVYLSPLKHRQPIAARGTVSLAGVTAACGLALIWAQKGGWWYPAAVLVKLAAFSLAACFCTECRKRAALYVAVWAVITPGFGGMIGQVLVYYYGTWGTETIGDSILYLLPGVVLYLIVNLTIARMMPVNGTYGIGPRQLSSALGLLAVFEILSYAVLSGDEAFWTAKLWIPVLLAQFYCVTMLYLQTELFKKSAMEKELEVLNLLWQKQKAQYQLARENIDLINRKCHDLKHQIAAIRGISDPEQREEYLSGIEQSIQIYDAVVQTGNEALDTILTEKSLYCKANGITINCVADGSRLSVLNTVDLYAILGNAVDNAIEGVSQIREAEKRLIDILIYNKDHFLVINIINPVGRELRFHDELPVSTKKDHGYHGYGLKSIRHYVQKYGGYMNISVKHSCFDLTLIIPLPEAAMQDTEGTGTE